MKDRINSRFDDPVEKRLFQDGKVGATSGWTVRGAADSWLCTMAAGGTNSTLVIPLPGLKKGDVIHGFHLIGQIESAGNTVTIDAALYKTTAAAADVVTAAVSGFDMTQLSVTADTKVSELNAKKVADAAKRATVDDNETYFLLLTCTTGASTDIALQAAALHVEPAR